MNSVVYTCGICGKPGVAKASPDCPVEWVTSLMKSLAHNHCFDLRGRVNDAAARVLNLATALSRLPYVVAGEAKRDSQRTVLRDKLTAATRDFAEAYCKEAGCETVWTAEFPRIVFESPDKAGAILASYRRNIQAEMRL